ncbi:flavodoxin family protein [Amycolatopsis aidingensis]|uniref:flavodoxin family protein n=1 Tax=Amycolatopsis aidingensis TaxID=2842453 RepID=UPI001C0E2639|nr:flavodoxin domain-containing protein [Amycolatopsis aidingensis]
MRAVIVYESMFGNTERVARALAGGLALHGTVDLLNVDDAMGSSFEGTDLIVAGGPTHTFGLSRANTRETASQQAGGGHTVSRSGLRDWLARLPPAPAGTAVAVFGTRVRKPRWLTGSAAHGTARLLRRRGYRFLARPQDFYVDGMTGPLAEGELARARQWGEELGTVCVAR